MTSTMLELLTYRRTFACIMLATFVVLVILIFLTSRREHSVRSAIEVATVFNNEKQEALDPPDQVARQVTGVYLYPALLAVADRGASPAALEALAGLRAEAIGRTVTMVSAIRENQKDDAKSFQQFIIDEIIKDRASFMQALRENIAARIATARRISGQLENQMKGLESEIVDGAARGEELRKQLEGRRSELSAKFQAPMEGLEARIGNEAEIRELRDQISAQQGLVNDIASERFQLLEVLGSVRRAKEVQLKIITSTQQEQQMLSETRVLLAPMLIPISTKPSTVLLLLAALIASALVAFGAVVLLYNFGRRTA
jgi:flagellar biosynthesis chaperone FliJ